MDFEIPVLAPSILAADFTRLGEQIRHCLDGGAGWIHCDIMDGHFVPNISYGPDVVAAAVRAAEDAFIDVHLMIEKSDLFIPSFADAGADLISVHAEACTHLHRTLANIRDHGCMNGVVINPATPVGILEPILAEVDLVLVMSVNPGFGGQAFIEGSFRKIEQLCRMREELEAGFLIEVDGGVGPDNIEELVQAGADVLVAGSSVFGADDISRQVKELQERANRARIGTSQ